MIKILKITLLLSLIMAVLLNLSWLKSPLAGLILGLLYFIIFGYLLGKIIFKERESIWQIIMGLFSLLSFYSLLGAILYYCYQLNQISVSVLIAVISASIILLQSFQHSAFQPKADQPLAGGIRHSALGIRHSELIIQNSLSNLIKPHPRPPKLLKRAKVDITSYNFIKPLILTLTYLILFAIAIYTLFISQTSQAIHSPWEIIPKAFFIVYFLATLNLLLILFESKATSYNLIQPHKTSYNIILVSLHFFLTTSVALIIYKLGYGFDPFIHRATELAIFNNGFILPKPFYYLGQYSLVITLAHIFQISTEWVDKLLLPIFLALFLPFVIYKSLTKSFNWPSATSQILISTFLIFPFGLFIVTTPQALANLFSLIILFLSFLYLKDRPGLGLAEPKLALSGSEPGQDRQIPFWYLGLLALATLAIHPLAGVPILIYLIIIWLLQKNTLATRLGCAENISNSFACEPRRSRTKIILPIFSGLAALVLPLALLLNSFLSIYKITISWPAAPLIHWPDLFAKQYWYFLDLSYLYINSIQLLFFIGSLIAFIYLIKRKNAKIFLGAALTFIILIANAFLLNFIKISSIINYEQNEFASRVWQLAFYFLLPIIIYGFYQFLQKTETKPFIYKSFIILLLSLLLSLSLYQSYPRFDDYENSNFINLTQNDLDTVRFIEQNASGQDYIVLTNQMASAAALKTFGFNRYYNGQYFYPIPTGGRLYEYFEQMIYQSTTKKTMTEAMDLTGVKTAYFVLPSYWSQFPVLSEKAQKDADAIYSLGKDVMIFKYVK